MAATAGPLLLAVCAAGLRSSSRPAPGRQWIFGAHHKSGSELLRYFAILQAWRMNLTYCLDLLDLGQTPEGCRERPASVWFMAQLEEEFLRNTAHNMRAVHAVRDPLEMIVSSYAYAVNPENTLDHAATGSVRNKPLREGLLQVAEQQLRSFLPPMAAVWTLADARTLHVRLEDFTTSSASFDRTARRVFEHMIGDVAPERVDDLVAWAGQFDLRRHPSNHSPGHVSPEELKDVARRALPGLPSDVLARLWEYRKRLGYV